ncbi:hypothetical protein OG2516_13646 [Oceanicola granulosus HTCC2516]|uniref:VOC domain-containing protein n=1 Tax=Oceanicola granulosus (strain ATCC BAA-861 / DSM 15982 / KCTC 12143 / HTCC2516) TaxID=314256 RepID=Q2CE18_OCEGH|nr:VOC family protein [Oceanicola granulosus]EAR50920.1 hypothetical protein OG2516_13646 [Oceanicola granulosus HTCC2516]
MIKLKQLAHVCIFAHDLDATRAFYEDVLGMKTVFDFTREGRVFGFYLAIGGRSHVEVFEASGAARGDSRPIDHMCLEVENILDAAMHIRGKGVEVTEPTKGVDETYQAWVTDPNGVKIELFEYTDRSAQFTGGDREANW